MRIIKHYSNRKYYDTEDRCYVTLAQIAALVRTDEDLRVIDHITKEDRTAVTLAQILAEEERAGPHLPVAGLVRIIRHGLPED